MYGWPSGLRVTAAAQHDLAIRRPREAADLSHTTTARQQTIADRRLAPSSLRGVSRQHSERRRAIKIQKSNGPRAAMPSSEVGADCQNNPPCVTKLSQAPAHSRAPNLGLLCSTDTAPAASQARSVAI